MARMLNPGVVLLRSTQLYNKTSCAQLSRSLSLPIHLLFGTVSYSSQQIRYSLSSISLWALKRKFHYEPSTSPGDFSDPRYSSAACQLESATATGYPLFNFQHLALFRNLQSTLAAARNLGAVCLSPSLFCNEFLCFSFISKSLYLKGVIAWVIILAVSNFETRRPKALSRQRPKRLLESD